jgi:hypothetical protein
MSILTRPFGHPKARKFLKGTTIKFQSLVVKGDTLQESAELSLVAEALEGRGPLSKTLKTEAKDLVAKFEKANPEFKFSAFKRNRNKESKQVEEATKPAKTVKTVKATKKPSKPKIKTVETEAVAS